MEELAKKPTAVITVSRLTSQEESVQITVNAYEMSIEALSEAVHCAGEALCRRVATNNARLMAVRDPIPMLSEGGSA